MDKKDAEQNNIVDLNALRSRAMRVTEALYRTTDLFPDAEPLKWSLRESAVKILNTLSEISQQPSYQELRNAQMLEKMIGALCYKLDLATGGTFIARSNFDVLDREYKVLGEKIMHGNFFALPVLTEQAPTTYQALVESDISDNRKLIVQKSPIASDTGVVVVEAITEQRTQIQHMPDIISAIDHPALIQKKYNADKVPLGLKVQMISAGSTERKDRILKLMKERGPSSVGDLTPLIDATISEKTIQRDLNALVEAGIVKKEGEKRWRRYYL